MPQINKQNQQSERKAEKGGEMGEKGHCNQVKFVNQIALGSFNRKWFNKHVLHKTF